MGMRLMRLGGIAGRRVDWIYSYSYIRIKMNQGIGSTHLARVYGRMLFTSSYLPCGF